MVLTCAHTVPLSQNELITMLALEAWQSVMRPKPQPKAFFSIPLAIAVLRRGYPTCRCNRSFYGGPPKGYLVYQDFGYNISIQRILAK